MNHPEQFSEFLACCIQQKIKQLHLAQARLIVNPIAADFGGVIMEFEDCMYFLTSKYLADAPEEVNEFCIQKIKSLADIRNEITEADIYKALAYDDISFVTEMVDEGGYFNGLELETKDFYLFLLVDCPNLIVRVDNDEELKHDLYPHQFGEWDGKCKETSVILFPEG